MSTDTDTDILAKLDDLPELLPVPTTALRLITACRDKNVGAKELCQIINCDPGLSFRLLKLSNSTRYGCGGKIKTLEHATVVLGTKGIRDLAVSVMASDLYEGGAEKNAAADLLWSHSLACATVARNIALRTDEVCPDEAFMSGIIHDIGKLVLIQMLEDRYDLIPDALRGKSTCEEELSRFGIDHAELAGQCADEWGLPLETSEALRDHHESIDPNVHSPLTSVVAAANQLAKTWSLGADSDHEIEPVAVVEQCALSLSESELAEIQETSEVEYEANRSAFESA